MRQKSCGIEFLSPLFCFAVWVLTDKKIWTFKRAILKVYFVCKSWVKKNWNSIYNSDIPLWFFVFSSSVLSSVDFSFFSSHYLDYLIFFPKPWVLSLWSTPDIFHEALDEIKELQNQNFVGSDLFCNMDFYRQDHLEKSYPENIFTV